MITTKRFFIRQVTTLGIIAGLFGGMIAALPVAAASVDSLIKLECATGASADDACRAVYYLGADSKRYVFPNEKTFKTWYSDFSTVQIVSGAEMGGYPIGGNVTYRPGLKMVKITTDPKVYAVSRNGTLRWVTTGDIAAAIYGQNWAKMIEDVPDSFFVNYKLGTDISAANQYDQYAELGAAQTISEDKQLNATPGTTPPPTPEPIPTPTSTPAVVLAENVSVATTWPTVHVSSTGSGDVKLPAVATSGKLFGMAWLERASGASGYDVYARLANQAGSVSAAPIRVTTSMAASAVTIGASADRFVAVWAEADATGGTTSLYSATMTRDGATVGAPVLIYQGTYQQAPRELSLVWNGKNFGLVYAAQPTGQSHNDIYFILVSPTGQRLQAPFQVTGGGAENTQPALAWNGSSFGLVWQANETSFAEIYYIPLDDLGYASLIPSPRLVSRDNSTVFPGQPSIAGSESNEFMISWYDFDAGGLYARQQIFIDTVTDRGTTVLNDYQVTEYDQTIDGFDPRVTWQNGMVTVVWRREGEVISRTSMDGASVLLHDKQTLAASAGISQLRTALSPSALGVVWVDQSAGSSRVAFTVGQ
jgi:hypothetical protein